MFSFDFVIIFVILWWIVLFIMLPFGIEKEKDTELGNDPGAPKNPMIKKKNLSYDDHYIYCNYCNCFIEK